MQEHLFKHLTLENVSVTLIDKPDGRDSRRIEDYWRKMLKTYTIFGKLVLIQTYTMCVCVCVWVMHMYVYC